jgi:hypothetical protein
MMLTRSPADLVLDALRSRVIELKQVGPQRWECQLRGHKRQAASARVADDWLHLRLPIEQVIEVDRIEEFLTWNGQLEGPSKFCLEDRQLCLAAEIPISDEIPFLPRLEAALQGVDQGLRMLNRPEASPVAASEPASAPGTAIDLAALCREAGWPHVVRPSGELAIELDVPRSFHQAILRAGPEQRLDLTVEIGSLHNLTPSSRRAVAVLLLSAAGVVRLARPAAAADAKRSMLWQVSLTPDVTAAELGHGLAALSVACRQCAREVKLLEDESIANDYLRVRGWSAPPKVARDSVAEPPRSGGQL